MKDRTFFLGWQDHQTHAWYPVGRLDASGKGDRYQFVYTRGALKARAQSGFEPLYDFPSFEKTYESPDLFPLFKNRIMTPHRRGFQEYLKLLDLEGMEPDPLEIVAIDGGYRATDAFQVFPKIEKDNDGRFTSRFFLHGWRHVSNPAQRRLDTLVPGEALYVAVELNNPATITALQLQTEDYHMIGWAPRYLVHDLMYAMTHAPGEMSAKVLRFNAMPAPSKQRVLIELKGHLPDSHTPMEYDEFLMLGD